MSYKERYNAACRYALALTLEYNKLLEENRQLRFLLTGDAAGGIIEERYNHNHDEKGRFCSADITVVSQINNAQSIESEFGKLKSNEIIITKERVRHIKEEHPGDYNYFKKYGNKVLSRPDIIIKDSKNDNTVFMIKKLEKTNLNVVVKFILDSENSDYSNSVITSYRIRDRNIKKLQSKNKILYKSE